MGGLGEIGKNMNAVRQGSGIILVDAGLAFPDDEMPGIDLVLPDFTYLRQHSDEFKGIVVTHGHEDHVGAIPYLVQEFNVPIYATRLTLGIIRSKLAEFGIKRADLREMAPGGSFRLAGFGVEFIGVNHSIPDSVAVALRTDEGLMVFSGDYKIDFTPIDGKPMDLGRLASLGDEGVLAYFGDSTNSEREGYIPSEGTVGQTLGDIFREATGRIIVASFASHLHRISQAVEAAKVEDRLVGVAGRSMVRNVEIARELGYLDLPSEMMVDRRDLGKIPDSDVAVLMTGSQGEPLAALSRAANGSHPTVEIGAGDTVVIAAHPIPGNERSVSRTINNLMRRGARVHYSPHEAVHVSGHAAREEQKLVLSLLKPRYFLPFHGEYRHQYHHAETAANLGVPRKNIFLLENGNRMEFADGNARQIEGVDAGMFLVDGTSFGGETGAVVRERQQLSEDGMFIVVARISASNGQPLGEPDVISRGFVSPQADGVVEDSVRVVTATLERTSSHKMTDWSELKNEIRKDLSSFLSDRTQKRPMILPLIVEV